MGTSKIKTWDDLYLELARIAKKSKSSRRTLIMYAKSYNRRLQRKKA